MSDVTNQSFAQSAGRLFGLLSAVVGVLLDAVAGNGALTTEAASASVAEFRKMIAEIAEQKRAHSTDYFIAELEALRREDSIAYEATAGRLRAFLGPPADTASV